MTKPHYKNAVKAGLLDYGDPFRLRENGRIYSVHEHARGIKMHGMPNETGDLYVHAICNKKMYAIDWHQRVIPLLKKLY